MSLNVERLRAEFPSLSQTIKKKPVIYLDSACMTLKPRAVIAAVTAYYTDFPGCHGRTDHHFGSETSREYQEARRKIQRFFNARFPEEIIFLRNATEGLNLLANTLDLKAGDGVLTSDLEHNSNLLPWQILEKRKKIRRAIVPTGPDTSFNMDEFVERLTPEIRLVSLLHVSNLTGVAFPVEEIIPLTHNNRSLFCLDAAQSALSRPIDVQKLDIDFMVASLHKMWGPTGVGVLYGKRELLEGLPQFLTGGGTVEDTTYNSLKEASLPDKFEAGLQDYAGVIGAGEGADFVKKTGQDGIREHIRALNVKATEGLREIGGIEIMGPADARLRSGIINIWINGMDVADAAKVLNESENIMTRFGKHCLHSWYNTYKKPDSLRISLSAYNTFSEMDALAGSLKSVVRFFRR